jgi:hypothetical protein
MAEQFQPTSVKDVPKDKFISAYAEHLKANDKVLESSDVQLCAVESVWVRLGNPAAQAS